MVMLKIIFLLLMTAAHPVHVSLLSIEYSADSEVFNVFLKVYYDDFILDYKLLKGVNPGFDFDGKKEVSKALIEEYVNERVQLFAGKTKLEGKINDLKLEDNELKMNLIFDEKKKSKKYTVKNFILTEIYKDQSNLVIFRYRSFEEGIKLTYEKTEQEFNLK